MPTQHTIDMQASHAAPKDRVMRHAVYYTPDSASDLHRLGSCWLGRDAWRGTALQPPVSRLAEITVSPRRYGLHATLKPPFHLKQNVAFAAFEGAVAKLASQHESFQTPPLALEIIDGFLALVPAGPCIAMENLATDCVKQLDDFRAPPGPEELQRRRAKGLSDLQEQLLVKWGYPYVLEEFRFHITLTDKLADGQAEWVWALAKEHFATLLGTPLVVDAISLMREPGESDDFVIHQRCPLVWKNLKAA